MRGVLSEKRFGYLLEVVERMRQQRIEPIRGMPFKLDGKIRHISGSLREWITILP